MLTIKRMNDELKKEFTLSQQDGDIVEDKIKKGKREGQPYWKIALKPDFSNWDRVLGYLSRKDYLLDVIQTVLNRLGQDATDQATNEAGQFQESVWTKVMTDLSVRGEETIKELEAKVKSLVLEMTGLSAKMVDKSNPAAAMQAQLRMVACLEEIKGINATIDSRRRKGDDEENAATPTASATVVK